MTAIRVIPPADLCDDANDTVDALVQAEAFISGFEDDPDQEGVADILAGLRSAINREQAAPAMLAALKQIVAACGGNPPDWLREEIASAEDAVAMAEGQMVTTEPPSLVPSLDGLRSCLERAERDEACAEMIDNFGRRQVELPKAKKRVAELRAQISRIEETL